MNKNKKNPEDKRDNYVRIGLNLGEYTLLENEAKTHGVPMATHLRGLLMKSVGLAEANKGLSLGQGDKK